MEIDDAILTVTESDTAKIEWPLNRGVINFFWIGCHAGLWTARSARRLSERDQGADYRLTAERNSLRSLVIPAPRGIIYDRFGKQLVYNMPSIDAILIPADIPLDPANKRR